MTWEEAAKLCEVTYGVLVDYYDNYFICPFCDEPVYADDFCRWDYVMCPICEEYF